MESLCKQMSQAGILCELRTRAGKKGAKPSSYKELWVKADIQLQWAVDLLAMFCDVGKN